MLGQICTFDNNIIAAYELDAYLMLPALADYSCDDLMLLYAFLWFVCKSKFQPVCLVWFMLIQTRVQLDFFSVVHYDSISSHLVAAVGHA